MTQEKVTRTVSIELDGDFYILTVDQARDLKRQISLKLEALKVKCSGCRCYIMPGESCYCCSEQSILDYLDQKDD